MKRFTETSKWDNSWFRKLSAKSKLLWLYLLDKCDNSGVIDIDFESASFFIGESIDESEILVFGERLQKLPNGKTLIVKFMPFQYGELFDNNPFHRSIINLAKRHGVTDKTISSPCQAPSQPLPSPCQAPSLGLPSPIGKGKGKGEGKGTEEGVKREGIRPDPLEVPEKLKTPEFMRRWGEWMNYRRGKGKVKDWVSLFKSQLEKLTEFDAATASKMLHQSMYQGWTGIFPVKDSYATGNNGSYTRPNPRNEGVIVGPTVYDGTIKPRYQREREAQKSAEAARQTEVDKQVAPNANNPPEADSAPGDHL